MVEPQFISASGSSGLADIGGEVCMKERRRERKMAAEGAIFRCIKLSETNEDCVCRERRFNEECERWAVLANSGNGKDNFVFLHLFILFIYSLNFKKIREKLGHIEFVIIYY